VTDVTAPADRGLESYRSTVASTFRFLKDTETVDDLHAKGIRLPSGRGSLVPAAELHADDERLIRLLAEWRERHSDAFPTQFPVTESGTARWLRGAVLDADDRLLFLVLDRHGYPVGHLGFANALGASGELEVDNVVRGGGGEPGLMSEAVRTLIHWAEGSLGPRSIHLRVFADNERAVRFYERLGFRHDATIPLRRRTEGDAVRFEERASGDDEPADREFLRMVYAPEREADPGELILTAGPLITAREASYALDAARYGWNNRWSDYIKAFEESFAEYLGVKHALSTSSCTGALHLALLALGIGSGDEVIVPDITWVATANAVAYTGATPVMVDVDEEGWCLSPAAFEAAITDRTRAVMPVHLYGQPARMDRILELAAARDIRVVEDAAPAIGAEWRGQRTGTFGDLAAFSFQGAKLVVTGEGGMLVTDDDELYEKAVLLWDQGRDPERTFWINETGWKYKMSNVQAAIGLGQLQQVDHLIEAKRRVFSWYEEDPEGVPHVELSREVPEARGIYWMSNLLLADDAPIGRDDLRAFLRERNVDSRPVFPPISQYPIWTAEQRRNPVAERVGRQALNLPSGVLLRREQVRRVAECVRKAVSA
jgi:perosamine synthetase